MPTLRRVLFYALVLAYLVLCPLVILYVLGYNIRPANKQALVHGGDLYVASFPIGATVYVDGRVYPRSTPSSVLNLPPGSHQVWVRMRGYLPWVQRVSIRAGRTTLMNDVLLIPRHWREEQLDGAAYQQLMPFSSDPHLLLRRGPRLEDLFLADTRQKKILPLAPPGSAYARAQVLASVALPQRPALLLEVRLDSLRARLLAELRAGSVDILDITQLAPQGIENLEWAAGRQGELFFCRDEAVTRIDLVSDTVYPRFLAGVRGFGTLGPTLYVLGRRGDVLTWEPGAAELKVLSGFEGIGSLFAPDEFVRLLPLRGGQMLFYGRKGGLVAASQAGRLPLGAVEGFQVETDLAEVVLWEQGRLGVLRLQEPVAPPQEDPDPGFASAVGPRVKWIPVRQDDIEQAFLVLAGTHILFRAADRVYLLSPTGDGRVRVSLVTRVRWGTSVYYSEAAGELYYIDPYTGRACGLQIVRKTQLVDQLLLDLRRRF
jgi:hypothetical protein